MGGIHGINMTRRPRADCIPAKLSARFRHLGKVL